jgi:uncharacterized CHY-type Zn-finger protein
MNRVLPVAVIILLSLAACTKKEVCYRCVDTVTNSADASQSTSTITLCGRSESEIAEYEKSRSDTVYVLPDKTHKDTTFYYHSEKCTPQ